MLHTLINDLVNKGCGKLIFGTSFVQVTKIHANMNGALFLEKRNQVGYPCGILNGIDEISLLELVDFSSNGFMSRRVDGSQLLPDREWHWAMCRCGVQQWQDQVWASQNRTRRKLHKILGRAHCKLQFLPGCIVPPRKCFIQPLIDMKCLF